MDVEIFWRDGLPGQTDEVAAMLHTPEERVGRALGKQTWFQALNVPESRM